ncbi:myosin light chain kinase, smooth muscle [Elysia marginata]|uniref:Myosin light chain kinase, smooth muscle n=1 Tax=Elysia marginata TaxID=1093978 RepID=A0AAV4HRZ3_9GAST|nr:myosin light chain kinase, smooth muscle [Elysia marginata]
MIALVNLRPVCRINVSPRLRRRQIFESTYNADERIHLENQRGAATLTIDALQRSEAGKMSVCLTNSIGTDQSSVNICIEGEYNSIGTDQFCVNICIEGEHNSIGTDQFCVNICIEGEYNGIGTDQFCVNICIEGEYNSIGTDQSSVNICREGEYNSIGTDQSFVNICIEEGEYNSIGTDQFCVNICIEGEYNSIGTDQFCVNTCREGEYNSIGTDQSSVNICIEGEYNSIGTDQFCVNICREGEYNCIGTDQFCVNICIEGEYNSIGTDQSSVKICIEDVPDAPIGKPQVYDLGRTSASLSWCGPASSGGNNVTHYSIEARTRQNGLTWDVVVSQCKDLTCHILDLKPCTTYQFRVRAANRHGLGPPSEASDKATTFDLFTSPSDYESDGFSEVFSPSVEYREDELPFEPRHVTFNTEEKFEDIYDLDKEVGKGKFGTVYKCRHKKDDTIWAAKVVKCRPRDKAALRMEVEIMNKLRHPKLLMLWDAFESNRQMVLVMEYVGAGELFERVIGEDFVLTERDCIHFLRQICEGVAYMHSQCVLHLDLKPENILCLSENSNRLSGLSPFLGDTDTETLSMVTIGEFDFDDEAFDEISEQAKDFISKLLVKRKEKRMLTADCLQHSWLNQDEVDGARYKRLNTDRLKRFMVRRKWLKTGNAVLAVSRLMKTTSILSRLGSSQSTSEENLLELSADVSTEAADSETFLAANLTEACSPETSGGVGTDRCKTDEEPAQCVVPNSGGGGYSAGGSDSNNNSDPSGNPAGTAGTNSSAISGDKTYTVDTSSKASLALPTDSHGLRPNESTSTQRSESTASRTSSLASPVDAHQHPSGITFSKLMANCKACKGDAARFDVTISGSSLPLRLKTSEITNPPAAGSSENSDAQDEILVSWYFDGEQVAQDEHYQMRAGTKFSPGNFSLIIRSVREEDEGEFSCRVYSSSSGEDMLCCRAYLSVLNV